MSNTLGNRVIVPDLIAILGSQYAEEYCGIFDSMGISRITTRGGLPSDKVEILQFSGLAKTPTGTGTPTLKDVDYTFQTPPDTAWVKTVSESVTLVSKKLRFADDKRVLTGYTENYGTTGDPLIFVRQAILDKFLSRMEDDLFEAIGNAGAGRKVSYTSQATDNAFDFKELKNAAIALSGRYATRDVYTLVCHPNVYAAFFDVTLPDVFKATNFLRVPNALLSTGLQFLQIQLNDKCPYDAQTGLYTSYLLIRDAASYIVQTWEIDLNPYGFGTYESYIRPTGPTIDSSFGYPVWFFEASWAFHVPKYDRPRICEFKCKVPDVTP